MAEQFVEQTPNGREIRWDERGQCYIVQPHNDNTWLRCRTLDEARDAYHHPERHR